MLSNVFGAVDKTSSTFQPAHGKIGNFIIYRATYASTVLAVVVCLSVRLSVYHKSELYKDG